MTDKTPLEYECPACKKRGKAWKGDDPVCAFKNGTFDNNNWKCATVGNFNSYVRWPDKTHPDVKITHCETEEHYATVNLENVSFPSEETEQSPVCLVVIWYKSRGRTDQMWLMFQNRPPRPPTEEELLLITQYLDASHSRVTHLKETNRVDV